MFILVAGILGCLFAILVIAVQDQSGKPMRPLEILTFLEKKELMLYNDLQSVCKKVNLHVTAGVPINSIVQAVDKKHRFALKKRLSAEVIPFLLISADNGKPVMAVLNTNYSSELGFVAMDAAKIPYIKLNNYNLPGLEKAIREKLGASLAAVSAQAAKETA